MLNLYNDAQTRYDAEEKHSGFHKCEHSFANCAVLNKSAFRLNESYIVRTITASRIIG